MIVKLLNVNANGSDDSLFDKKLISTHFKLISIGINSNGVFELLNSNNQYITEKITFIKVSGNILELITQGSALTFEII